MQNLDMPTAVSYLSNTDVAMQMLGAAYIQHQCYHSTDAKSQVTMERDRSLVSLDVQYTDIVRQHAELKLKKHVHLMLRCLLRNQLISKCAVCG